MTEADKALISRHYDSLMTAYGVGIGGIEARDWTLHPS